MIRFDCPSCGKTIKVKDEGAGRKGKCPGCGEAIQIPKPAPPPTPKPEPSGLPVAVPDDDEPQAAPPPIPHPKREVIEAPVTQSPQFDSHQVIGVWIAGGGLLVLFLSPFFKWINLGAGGITGISGDGKILLAITAIGAIAYVAAIVRRKWLTPVLLSVQAWGTLAVFWMGALLWKVSSVHDSAEVEDNPFAAMFSTLISPGAGLYLGLMGGIAVAGALGFVAVRHLLLADNLKPFYVSQGLSCVLGILLAVFVGPGLAPKANDTGSGSLVSSAPKEELPQQRTIRLGETITLQSLEITPQTVEFCKVKALLYSSEVEAGPYLVLTCRLQNISAGQVFRPFFIIHGKDSFGNELQRCESYGWHGSHNDDIRPGEEVTFLACMERKIDTATSYVWDIRARVNNKVDPSSSIIVPADALESWRLEFDADEIEIPAPPKTREALQAEWKTKHSVSDAQWDELISNITARNQLESDDDADWWDEVKDKTPAQLNELYPPVQPWEWYSAEWFGKRSRELDSTYTSGRYWLNMSLIVSTEPNLVVKELHGHLKILKDQKVIYETRIEEKPDKSFKDRCFVMHTINPYDDTNETHRTLRYAENNELTPVFTVSKVVLADGTEKTFD